MKPRRFFVGRAVGFLVIAVVLGGFFLYNSYINNEKQAEDPEPQEVQLEARLGHRISAFGLTLTPQEVLEDSRCPTDVTCIQAGTVRVRAALESEFGTTEQEFTLNAFSVTELARVTLVQVDPAPHSEQSIANDDYLFLFELVQLPR